VESDPIPIVVLKIIAVKSRHLTFWPGGSDTPQEVDTKGAAAQTFEKKRGPL
jgi:hypothetical protein